MVMKEKAGFVCDGQRLVYVTYSVEDFENLWGGGLQAFKDFLLARQREFQRWQGNHYGTWIITVPFDQENFSAWLKENPLRRHYRDPHASWALWVTQNSERLEKIRTRHPLQNYILKDESLKTCFFAWLLPVIAPDAPSMRQLSSQLPQELTSQIRQELLVGLLQSLPEFRRLSPSRGRGVDILPVDTLVHPSTIDRISEQVEKSLITTWDKRSSTTFHLPKEYRFSINPNWRYPRVAILCFPLVAVGSAFDCETVTMRITMAESKDLPLDTWINYFHSLGMELYPGKGADFAIAGFVEHIQNELQRDLPPNLELQPQRPEYLRRIK